MLHGCGLTTADRTGVGFVAAQIKGWGGVCKLPQPTAFTEHSNGNIWHHTEVLKFSCADTRINCYERKGKDD